MKAKGVGLCLSVASVLVLLFPGLCRPQGFTATTIGDFGNISVIEVSGNYDAKLPDGSINGQPRQMAAKEFFRTHKDEYDFLVIFSNFDFAMPEPEAAAFYLGVRNDVEGIGCPVVDDSGLFGSNGKLQGTIDMGNMTRMPLSSIDPLFEDVLSLLSHEQMHRWGAYVRFRGAEGEISSALLGRDGVHWSFLLDSSASLLFGNQWMSNADGTFTSIDARRGYSPLDLYLMGLYEKTQVPPMLLIANPVVDPTRLPEIGVTIEGVPSYVTIDDIVAVEGERIPPASISQKAFRTAFILITAPGTFSGDEVYGLESLREEWTARFSILTDGLALVDARLIPREEIPVNPGPVALPVDPRTDPANIADGVSWLMARQRLDGNWVDLSQTSIRDTATAVNALAHFPAGQQNHARGIGWLGAVAADSMDSLTRKSETFTQSGRDTASLIGDLLSRQNPDGGFGSDRKYLSNSLDTALAAKTLSAAGEQNSGAVSKAVAFLKERQNSDGGWGMEDEESTVQATSAVLVAFQRYRAGYAVDDAISRGTAWLLARQNHDGGFGNSPSTVYDTAVAVVTLKELGVSKETTDAGLVYLLALQSEDGSWHGSVYETALAVDAVRRATIDPDLFVKADEIVFDPPAVTALPTQAGVTAIVRNLGRSDVPAVTVALYEGLYPGGTRIGEQATTVGGLSASSVTFSTTILDGNEHVFTVVVDPENGVKEPDKVNNKASKVLASMATWDFEVLASDLSVTPNVTDLLQEVRIKARIANRGTRDGTNVQVKYTFDTTGGPVDIATSTVSIPANGSVMDDVTWKAVRAGENVPITVHVDPFNRFVELAKGNNIAMTFLTVKGSTEPNLTLDYRDITITPLPARERGDVTVSALVRNDGSSAASDVEIRFSKGVPGADGVPLGSRIIPSLGPGESSLVFVEWTQISESGGRIIYVQVDPDNRIREIREDDNEAFVVLPILSLPDLAVSSSSIVFSPAAPKEGDVVSIRVTVQNRGEQEAENVLVRVVEGTAVIGTATIPAVPGNGQATAAILYDTAGRPGLHTITVQVDPGHAVAEQSGYNNEASRTFAVQNADLWLTESTISPNGDGVKDGTEFFFRLASPQTVNVAVVSGKGLAVRTFGGVEYENTTGGHVGWDGLDDNGRVVDDGAYQIQVLSAASRVIGSLPVVVDNNRSPFIEAIGTKYLLNRNLTCLIPDALLSWFPDEQGLLLSAREPNGNTPDYPTGLYTMAPDGGDVVRIVPGEWSKGTHPVYDYLYEGYSFSRNTIVLSPSGSRIAFALDKVNRVTGEEESIQLWAAERDGRNLTLLHVVPWPFPGTLDGLLWSPDEEFIAFKVSGVKEGNTCCTDELWVTKADGTWNSRLDSAKHISGTWLDQSLLSRWSPDGGRVAYFVQSEDQIGGGESTVRTVDLGGTRRDVFTSTYYGTFLEWLSESQLVVYHDQGSVTMVDVTGVEPPRVVTEAQLGISPSPDRLNLAFKEAKWDFVEWRKYVSVNFLDATGRPRAIYASPYTEVIDYGSPRESLSDVIWSHDGRRVAFVDLAYTGVDVLPSNGAPAILEPHLVMIDVANGSQKATRLGEIRCDTYEGGDFGHCVMSWDSPRFDMQSFLNDDTHVLVTRWGGTKEDSLIVNSETGEEGVLPDVSGAVVSPLGGYVTYRLQVDRESACYGKGERDEWVIGSLLNLTADLRVIKEKNAVVLKGTAEDRHFEGYRLEFSDMNAPGLCYPIGFPSEVPARDETLTSWVPPYEGVFSIRLTAWDKAGNIAWDTKRVSWGLSSSITNLYTSLEIFSPNGDGVKDSVELHYTVLEPVHLVFFVHDEKDKRVRSYSRDHAAGGVELISWDGRDEEGKVVPDGKYRMKILDHEFFVEVDGIPPDARLALGRLSNEGGMGVDLSGYAVDRNLKSWLIEYGEGENPVAWFEWTRGEDTLAAADGNGTLLTNPAQDKQIERFAGPGLEWLVGKKLRMTVEDFAGNRTTKVTDFLEEVLILNGWDGETIALDTGDDGEGAPFGVIPGHLGRPGPHSLGAIETVRRPIVEVTVEEWREERWVGGPALIDPVSGAIDLSWDNTAMNPTEGFAVRLKAVDLLGREHYSNPLYTKALFSIHPSCGESVPLSAVNSLFEPLQALTLQVQSWDDPRYTQWTPYAVFDANRGDSLPEGKFNPPLPAVNAGMKYRLRMTGTGLSGATYESTEVSYPIDCPLHLSLKVDYEEADCGVGSGKAFLSAGLDRYRDHISFETLDFSIVEAGNSRILKRLDLTREKWDGVTLDTASMVEGVYPVTAILTYRDENDGLSKEASAAGSLAADRVSPTAQIIYPGNSPSLCPMAMPDPMGYRQVIAVEGVATDNRQVKEYALFYAVGEGPSEWRPALAMKGNQLSPIAGKGAVQGRIGLWDVTDLKGNRFSLRLRAVDASGNASCHATTFRFDDAVEITQLVTDKRLFSPNGDGVLDEVVVSYGIAETAVVDVKVFRLRKNQDETYSLESEPVRTLASGQTPLNGTVTLSWDGKDDSGTTVADGLYGLTVFARDSCGNTKTKWTAVEADRTVPAATISYPRPSEPIGNIVEIKGTAADLHFQSYLLEAGQGENPGAWIPLATGGGPVEDSLLGRWNTFGLEGLWTLRLSVADEAGNRGGTTVVLDLGARKTLIKDLAVSPKAFSPNNDGKLDTARVTYEITDVCTLGIEVSDSTGAVVKAVTPLPSPVGVGSYVWDGRAGTGVFVPDGIYEVRLSAALSSNPSVEQREVVRVAVDTTAPVADIRQPLNNSYHKGDVLVIGTIRDQNLEKYAIAYAGTSSTGDVDKGTQNRENHVFGILPGLPEGDYSLTVKAKDLAENSLEGKSVFTVDRTPPKVVLDAPREGEHFGSERNPVSIRGTLVEKNLEAFTLRYGAGDHPEQWIELLSGPVAPANPQTLAWKVGATDGVADGRYTLSFFAQDKAGWTGEARVKITVDNTAPEAMLTFPADGGYVKTPVDIRGTAFDLNLDRHTLEIAEKECGAASKWVALKSSAVPVRNGLIYPWRVLPSDGDYCLKLTVVDKAGNKNEARVGVKVDTHPPASPVLSGVIENRSNAKLAWTGNGEPDLAGYNLYRDGQRVNTTLTRVPGYFDQGLREGVYVYTVTSVDLAGNESKPSSPVKLTVDLTGPEAKVRSPQDGGRVGGLVDIRGTAWSAGDFKQYRVSIGQGVSPSAWTLIRTSPLPVSFGSLAPWDTFGTPEGIWSIRVEAEDIAGNTTTHQVTVTVDNSAPGRPSLLTATTNGPDVALTWQANNEADLAGYLLYRNGQLATVSGVMVGDLRPYLLQGTGYTDRALPDGSFIYSLAAVDLAQNVSDLSNTLEVEIDTRTPRATIVEPVNGAKFQTPILVKADSPDRDIASVRFQYKKAQDSAWLNLGGPATLTPYTSYVDPIALGLVYGDYHLRAIATDRGGRTDPSPATTAVAYTDVTSPYAPKGLVAKVDGNNVTLTWTANAETDLDGYNLYKASGGAGTRVNTSLVREATYQDRDTGDGTHLYTVKAVDTYGNESDSSAPASAKVYAPVVAQPYTPTGTGTIEIQGFLASVNALVEAVNETGSGSVSGGAIHADAQGNFALPNVVLAVGENRLTARATDGAGNRSRPSEMVVVVFNEAPSPPSGLAVSVAGDGVTLTWSPNAETDLAGYHVYRDGQKLNAPSSIGPQEGTASSSDPGSLPSRAFDGDTGSFWSSSLLASFPLWWEVSLPSPELISRVQISWGEGVDAHGAKVLFAGRDCEVQVWSGYAWITRAAMSGNDESLNSFDLSPPYRTDKVRINLLGATDPGGSGEVRIAEVALVRENPVTQPSYTESGLENGYHDYRVTAIDDYGFESLPSEEAKAAVGDVIAPEAPRNLTALVPGARIALTWNANTESDLAGYNVYKKGAQGWQRLNTVLLPTSEYADSDLPNGTYFYRVTAVDGVGNESLPSDEVSAVVYTDPPAAPVRLFVSAVPEGGALRAVWEVEGGPVASFRLYRGQTAGGPFWSVSASPVGGTVYVDTGLTNGITYYYVVAALDALGNESVYSNTASAVPADVVAPEKPGLFFPASRARPATVLTGRTDLAGSAEPGSTVELFRNGISSGTTKALGSDSVQPVDLGGSGGVVSLSPDGKTIAYEQNGSLLVKALDTGEILWIAGQGGFPRWSPDGKKVSYTFADGDGYDRIGLYDVASKGSGPLTGDSQVSESESSWSADGGRIAFISDREGSRNGWVVGLSSGAMTQVTEGVLLQRMKLSPDGGSVAYSDGQVLSIRDLATGSTVQADTAGGAVEFDWSPEGRRLAFASRRNGGGDIIVFDTETQDQGQLTDSEEGAFAPVWSPDGRNVAYGSREVDGSVSVRVVSGERPGEGRTLRSGLGSLEGLSWVRSGAIAYTTPSLFELTRPGGSFVFGGVDLDAGENRFVVTAADGSGNVSPPSDEVLILFDTSRIPDLEVTADEIVIYPPFPLAGEEASVTVTVRNGGLGEAEEVDVQVYLWDAGGGLTLLASERIPTMAALGEASITAAVDTAGRTGTNRIMVVVDTEERIGELSESNNFASKEFMVVEQAGLSMSAAVDADYYESGRDVTVTVQIINAAMESNAEVVVRVEDDGGALVASLASFRTALPYGSERNEQYVWNTGATFAGAYRLRAVLKEGPEVRVEKIVPFTILADRKIGATVVTDKTDYGSGEEVEISVTVRNEGRNDLLTDLKLRTRVLDRGDREVMIEEREVKMLLPGGMITIGSIWSTGLWTPGDYCVVVETLLGGQVLSTGRTFFRVTLSLTLTGMLNITPSVVLLGNEARIEYGIRNNGNGNGMGLLVRLGVNDLETQTVVAVREEAIDLAMGTAWAGTWTFPTEGYGLKTYSVSLQVFHQGISKSLASASFNVRDGTPPGVTILSPPPESSFGGRVDLAAVAVDPGSGVDRMEYRIDGGPYRLLPLSDPSSGRYGAIWLPVKAEEGSRTIGFRAVDRAGNVTIPVSVAVTIDLTPPEAPFVSSPGNNATVPAETVDIRGVAEPGATVTLTGADLLTARADSVTGAFLFVGVRLVAGTNVFVLTAADRCGNVSGPRDYVLNLSTGHTITSTPGVHGTISPSGPVAVNHGASQTFTVTPDAGCHIEDVKVDGVSVGAVPSYTFSGVASDHAIEANFAVNSYSIVATPGQHGTVSPSGPVVVGYGESQTFTFAPDAGYRIFDVKVDWGSMGVVTSYIFSDVASDHTLTATFRQRQVVTLPFADDFEESPVGVEPGPPWDSLVGGSAVVVETESHSGSKSISLGEGTPACRTAFVDLGDVSPDRVGYEAWVKVSEDTSGFIGFLEPVADRVPQFNAIFLSGEDGKVYFHSDDGQGEMVPLMENLSAGVWHKVRVDLNFANLTGNVTVDGVVVGQGFAVTPKSAEWDHDGTTYAFPLSKVGVTHVSGGPIDVDDVSIFEPVSGRPPVELLRSAGPDHWAVLALGGIGPAGSTKVSMSGLSSVLGPVANVGVAEGGSMTMTGTSVIGGALYLNSAGSLSRSWWNGIFGGVKRNTASNYVLDQAVADALAASESAAALSATLPSVAEVSISQPTQSLTITGGPGVNVVRLGNLSISHGELTLTAPAGGSFVINVSGKFTLSGWSAIRLAGDLTPKEVLFNVTGGGPKVSVNGAPEGIIPNAMLRGILLAPQREISIGQAVVNGEVIAGGTQIKITNLGEVFNCDPSRH